MPDPMFILFFRPWRDGGCPILGGVFSSYDHALTYANAFFAAYVAEYAAYFATHPHPVVAERIRILPIHLDEALDLQL